MAATVLDCEPDPVDHSEEDVDAGESHDDRQGRRTGIKGVPGHEEAIVEPAGAVLGLNSAVAGCCFTGHRSTIVERDMIGIGMTRHARKWEVLQVGLIAAMFVAAAVRWGSVPDRIPVHWNAAGEVDGYGGKFVGLLLLPLVALGLYGLLKYVPRIDPARRNYEAFAGSYLLVRVTLTVYLGFIYVVTTLAIGNEESLPVAGLIVGSVGVLFIVLGGAMSRFRPNFFAGIRTPWTLTSERSWVRTHRIGGRIFIAAGVATMLGALIGSEWAIIAMLIVITPGVIFLVGYSYFVWRDDPDRVAAQDVMPGAPDRSS